MHAFRSVEDAQPTFERLTSLGAGVVSKPTDVGGGVVVATVSDPFGNPFGLIEEND